MSSFKNKLYNYEAVPPGEIWDNLHSELQHTKETGPVKKRNSGKYYLAVAAASLVILFLGSLFFKNNTADRPGISANRQPPSPEKMKDSMLANKRILESIIHSPKEKQEIVANNFKASHMTTKYITIAGPEGQPIKISPKAATLIIAADNEFPPKPTWSKKIDRWQKIMLSSTVSPTSAGLADMIQLASAGDKFE